MAQLLPKLVMSVIAGLSRYFDALDWTTSGTPVLTWPSERKGANSGSRLVAAEEEGTERSP